MHPSYEFSGELWIYNGEANWHFVTLPVDISKEIKSFASPRPRFGSVRVEITLGQSIWKTSIFPDSKIGSYILPIKKEVRTQNKIAAGDKVEVTIALTDI